MMSCMNAFFCGVSSNIPEPHSSCPSFLITYKTATACSSGGRICVDSVQLNILPCLGPNRQLQVRYSSNLAYYILLPKFRCQCPTLLWWWLFCPRLPSRTAHSGPDPLLLHQILPVRRFAIFRFQSSCSGCGTPTTNTLTLCLSS